MPLSRPAPPSVLAPLVVTGLSVTYADRTVLTGVDLLAPPGRRIGLVGENGTGKSTLLRAVAGRLPARYPASDRGRERPATSPIAPAVGRSRH